CRPKQVGGTVPTGRASSVQPLESQAQSFTDTPDQALLSPTAEQSMISEPTITRFAPSPTGYLHLGHVRSALEGWRAAREAGGRFLLRIEDIDHTRCRPEYTDAIVEDLHWLGLDWDRPIRKQSEHLGDYRAALSRLDAMALLYPCFCTRREIQAELARAGAPPQGDMGTPYPGTCRPVSASEREAR